MIALLFAGQHTSSVTGSWTGLLLFEANNKKKFLPGVLEEQEVCSYSSRACNAITCTLLTRRATRPRNEHRKSERSSATS